MTRDALVYKICTDAEWTTALGSGRYAGSADDLRDGFIHFSCAHQLRTTAAKYFTAQTSLVLIAVEASALGAALRYEPSRGGDLFPHLYGSLDVRAARWVKPLPWEGEMHRFPEGL